MNSLELCNRTYTAEVLRVRNGERATERILGLTNAPRTRMNVERGVPAPAFVWHAFVATREQYHRATRRVGPKRGQEIPRRKVIRGETKWLYDVLVASCRDYVVVAVPFHRLAGYFFGRVDAALAGTRFRYQRLDITRIVIELGELGTTAVSAAAVGDSADLMLGLTRCQLAYSDPDQRSTSLQQVRMTGSNLGNSKVYQKLVAPVLRKKPAPTVTPTVLGFSLFVNQVKRSSAVTDRHGNFKLWLGTDCTKLTRVFSLLYALQDMEEVALSTSNLPIRSSKALDDEGGQ